MMPAVFSDTSYYLALLNARDEHHAAATNVTATLREKVVTTTWVLTEVADAFSKPGQRDKAAILLGDLQGDSRVTVIPPTLSLYERGLAHYADRPDKDWSLTDCISFLVMEQEGLTEALSADHHFEQAGFTLLLK